MIDLHSQDLWQVLGCSSVSVSVAAALAIPLTIEAAALRDLALEELRLDVGA